MRVACYFCGGVVQMTCAHTLCSECASKGIKESAPSTDVQQLKAEIAAVIDYMERKIPNRQFESIVTHVYNTLRQLSAV